MGCGHGILGHGNHGAVRERRKLPDRRMPRRVDRANSSAQRSSGSGGGQRPKNQLGASRRRYPRLVLTL